VKTIPKKPKNPSVDNVSKKPRAKKSEEAVVVDDVDVPVAEVPVETKTKKPRAKKTKEADVVVEVPVVDVPVETKTKKPRAKKTKEADVVVEVPAVDSPILTTVVGHDDDFEEIQLQLVNIDGKDVFIPSPDMCK